MERVTKDKVTWLKYVTFDDIQKYEEHGWIVASVGGVHAVIMEWAQEGEPQMPDKE